jgi:hypothetical protein
MRSERGKKWNEQYFSTMAIIDEQYFLTTTIVDEWYFLTTAIAIEQYFSTMAIAIEQYFLMTAVTSNISVEVSLYTCKTSITSKDGTFFGHQSVRVVFPDPACSHFVYCALQMRGAPVLLQCDRLGFYGL